MSDDIQDGLYGYIVELYRLLLALAKKLAVIFDEEEDYQDIAHEALLRILTPHYLERLYPWTPAQRYGFLRVVVRHLIIDLLRKRPRLSSLDDLWEIAAPEHYEPDHGLLEQEAERLPALLRELAKEVMSEEQDEVFAHRLHGKPHKEIARILGISEEASRKRLHDGRSALVKAAIEKGLI